MVRQNPAFQLLLSLARNLSLASKSLEVVNSIPLLASELLSLLPAEVLMGCYFFILKSKTNTKSQTAPWFKNVKYIVFLSQDPVVLSVPQKTTWSCLQECGHIIEHKTSYNSICL